MRDKTDKHRVFNHLHVPKALGRAWDKLGQGKSYAFRREGVG